MIKAWSIRLCKGLSIKVLKQITTTILEMYERLVNSKWGSMFKVKAQTQVAQLYSTLTLSLIWIGNMISSKWKTRWGCTHPKQHKSYRPSKRLCMARIMKPRRFKTLRKRQTTRLKNCLKLKLQNTFSKINQSLSNRWKMKAFNQVWALTILMVPPCNTRTSYQTWTSDTRTNTKLQWWKCTRPKLPRSSRRSSKSEMVKITTKLWLISGSRKQLAFNLTY